MDSKKLPTKEQLQDFVKFMLNKMQSPSPEFLTSLIGDYVADAKDVSVLSPIILTTFDGVKVTNPNQWVHGLSNGNIKVSEIADYAKSDIKWFSTPEARTEYMATNMRLFSLQDLLEIEINGGSRNTEKLMIIEIERLKALAHSRVNQ